MSSTHNCWFGTPVSDVDVPHYKIKMGSEKSLELRQLFFFRSWLYITLGIYYSLIKVRWMDVERGGWCERISGHGVIGKMKVTFGFNSSLLVWASLKLHTWQGDDNIEDGVYASSLCPGSQFLLPIVYLLSCEGHLLWERKNLRGVFLVFLFVIGL